jgi:hypothetical protein
MSRTRRITHASVRGTAPSTRVDETSRELPCSGDVILEKAFRKDKKMRCRVAAQLANLVIRHLIIFVKRVRRPDRFAPGVSQRTEVPEGTEDHRRNEANGGRFCERTVDDAVTRESVLFLVFSVSFVSLVTSVSSGSSVACETSPHERRGPRERRSHEERSKRRNINVNARSSMRGFSCEPPLPLDPPLPVDSALRPYTKKGRAPKSPPFQSNSVSPIPTRSRSRRCGRCGPGGTARAGGTS